MARCSTPSLLAQVYVELTGGRQIGLGLVAEAGSVAVSQPPARSRCANRARRGRTPRGSRNLNATARLLPRLVNPLWARFAGRPVDGGFGAVLSGPPVIEEHGQVDVRVADHQVDTGESLREHAQRRVAEITEKYFSRSVGANVTFGRGPNNDYTCDIVAPVAQGVVLKASHSAREAQMAFNGAADRIEKQLRRYTQPAQGP